MANPTTAKAFTDPLDPADIDFFDVTISKGSADTDTLRETENVASYTLTATAEAVAAGLTIESTGGREPALTGLVLRYWLSIASASQSSALFSGAGVDLAIELTVITDSTPSRRKQGVENGRRGMVELPFYTGPVGVRDRGDARSWPGRPAASASAG